MYKSILLPLAKKDIQEAALWYHSKQKGLGKRFTTEVREKVNLIIGNPLIFEIRYDHTRCVLLDIFPFMIHYSIDELNKLIIINAVFHTSLNPEKWKKRI